MNKKLRATIFVVALLSCTTMAGNSLRAVAPTHPLMPTSTVNIPPGSAMWIVPNNADPTFAANLQDRMNFEGLFGPPYNLTIAPNSGAANFWLIGGTDEIYIPDGWIVGTLYVVKPTTLQILNAYTSRAAYPTYDEIYVCRKLAQNGIKPDVY